MPNTPVPAETSSNPKPTDPGNTLTIDQFESLLDAITKANAKEGRKRKRLCEALSPADEPIAASR